MRARQKAMQQELVALREEVTYLQAVARQASITRRWPRVAQKSTDDVGAYDETLFKFRMAALRRP